MFYSGHDVSSIPSAIDSFAFDDDWDNHSGHMGPGAGHVGTTFWILFSKIWR